MAPITVYALKVLGLAGPITAAVVTLVRLFERIRNKRFGYDDGFAALSLTFLVIVVVALFTHLGDPIPLSPLTRVAMYYILAQGFYCIIWTARLSIMFSVIRITPQGSKIKQLLYCLAGSFVLLWAILFAQVFWVCEREPLWKDTLAPQCALGKDVAIAQLISDIYADSVLIIAPLRLLWNLEVSRTQRNRLLLVFSSSIVTTVASLIHAYYVLRVGGVDEVFVAFIELCVSLLVCNLAVVVGLASRLIESGRKSSQPGTESYSMSSSSRSQGKFGWGARSLEFKHSVRTVDDTLSNVKVIDLHHDNEPFRDPTYPKERGGGVDAYHYPTNIYKSDGLA